MIDRRTFIRASLVAAIARPAAALAEDRQNRLRTAQGKSGPTQFQGNDTGATHAKRETIQEAGNRRFYQECRDAGGGASSDPDGKLGRKCHDANGNELLN